jgi:hypothetical protein
MRSWQNIAEQMPMALFICRSTSWQKQGKGAGTLLSVPEIKVG